MSYTPSNLVKSLYLSLDATYETRMDYYDTPIEEREWGKEYHSWKVKKFNFDKFKENNEIIYYYEYLEAFRSHLQFLYQEELENLGYPTQRIDFTVSTIKAHLANDYFDYRYDGNVFTLTYNNSVEDNPFKNMSLSISFDDFSRLGRMINRLTQKKYEEVDLDSRVLLGVKDKKMGLLRINQSSLIKTPQDFQNHLTSILVILNDIYYHFRKIKALRALTHNLN